jgi:hypothetical protein
MLLYVNDYDDTLPIAFGNHPSLGYLWGYYLGVPADWRPGSSQARIDAYAGNWANVMFPYVRNYGLYACPSGAECPVGGSWAADYAHPAKPPVAVTYQYNGILHSYPLAGVGNPGGVELLWEGNGNVKLLGAGTANPVVVCNDPTKACVYAPSTGAACAPNGDPTANPSNGGSSVMYLSDGSLWVHSGGATFIHVDTHARWRRLGANHAPGPLDCRTNTTSYPTDRHTDPGTDYDSRGFPCRYWTYGGTTGRDICHPCRFRPDYDPSDQCW